MPFVPSANGHGLGPLGPQKKLGLGYWVCELGLRLGPQKQINTNSNNNKKIYINNTNKYEIILKRTILTNDFNTNKRIWTILKYETKLNMT